MKYIKSFEKQLTTEEKESIGNYVIVNPISSTPNERKFFNNNIGKIVGISINPVGNENSIKVEYDKNIIPSYVILNKDNTYYVKKYEIIHEYKDKEELSAYLYSKKFNI